MSNTVTRVEKKVGRALSSFQKAHDAVVAAEADASAEIDSVNEQIDALHRSTTERIDALVDYRAQVFNTKASASAVRQKLAHFVIA